MACWRLPKRDRAVTAQAALHRLQQLRAACPFGIPKIMAELRESSRGKVGAAAK
jgi:hypothetical protein